MASGRDAKELTWNPLGKGVPVNYKPGCNTVGFTWSATERLSHALLSDSVCHVLNLSFLFCTIISADLFLIRR